MGFVFILDCNRRWNSWAAAFLAICWILSTGLSLADPQAATTTTKVKEVHFGAIQGIYPNVSRTDGRMALELLLQKTIVDKSYPYTVKLSFIDPVTNIPDAILKGGYHFITLSSIDYYKYRNVIHLEPIMIPSKTDKPAERLSLLVAKERSLAAILKKEQRVLIIETGSSGDLSQIWLDTLLEESGLPKSRRFFTDIRRVSKPARAIIPVFFNQADACIVTQYAFDTIKELNPQMNQRVEAVYQSEPLIRLMICATAEPTPKDIGILVREATNMVNNPETEQAMTILQMKRFVRVSSEDLAATEALLKRYGQIAKRMHKN